MGTAGAVCRSGAAAREGPPRAITGMAATGWCRRRPPAARAHLARGLRVAPDLTYPVASQIFDR